MVKLKKITALFTTLLLCGATLAAASCGKGNSGQSSSSPSSEYIPPEPSVFTLEEHTWTDWETVTEKTCTRDGEERLVCTDEGCGAVKTRTVKAGHVWSNWTGSTNDLCVEDAELSRICADCQTVERQTVEKRGHAYGNDGVCKVCRQPFVFPDLQPSAYVDVWGDDVRGSGSAFSRKLLSTDTYYTLEVPATDEENEENADYGVWISLPVNAPGQYALLTVGGSHGVAIDRFDASDYYIPGDENGYVGFSAIRHANGEDYSLVSCSEMHFNPSWRATWRFSAETSATVKFVIVKVEDAEWLPEYIHETAIPTQINNVTADEAPEGYTPFVVDYNDDYYFDEWNGVYRRGTKANPGEVIYVAITSEAERLFGEKTFVTIQEDGNNLSLSVGTDERGNYLIRDYHAFLLADSAQNGNAYQNFVNSDGLYPVTQELYEFLQLYTQKNRPFNAPENGDGSETEVSPKAWLAPCYCYRQLTPGSEENPFLITELGDFNAEITSYGSIVYFTVKYFSEDGSPTTTLTLTCSNPNAMINVHGKAYMGPFSINIEVDATGTTFFVGARNGETSLTFNLSVPTTGDEEA